MGGLSRHGGDDELLEVGHERRRRVFVQQDVPECRGDILERQDLEAGELGKEEGEVQGPDDPECLVVVRVVTRVKVWVAPVGTEGDVRVKVRRHDHADADLDDEVAHGGAVPHGRAERREHRERRDADDAVQAGLLIRVQAAADGDGGGMERGPARRLDHERVDGLAVLAPGNGVALDGEAHYLVDELFWQAQEGGGLDHGLEGGWRADGPPRELNPGSAGAGTLETIRDAPSHACSMSGTLAPAVDEGRGRQRAGTASWRGLGRPRRAISPPYWRRRLYID